jgi:hypothetical protein
VSRANMEPREMANGSLIKLYSSKVKPKRSVQLVEADAAIQGLKRGFVPNFSKAAQLKRPAPSAAVAAQANKRLRKEKDELQRELFALFNIKGSWTLKELTEVRRKGCLRGLLFLEGTL